MKHFARYAALLALAVTHVACDTGDDDAPAMSDKDGGHGSAGKQSNGGHKPGIVRNDGGGVLELNDSGRPIERDGAIAPTGYDGGEALDRDGGGPASTQPLEVPVDPGARGPWAVGVRTLQVDLGSGQSTPAEVWYPAQWQSEVGTPLYTYDLADFFPPEARAALPPDELPIPVPCNCYRDLPIDAEHGPYPIAIVVHAWGGARVEAATMAAHWASRGFIAIAADHPQVTLVDTWALLGERCTGSGISEDLARTRDVPATLRAMREATGEWAFLAERADLSKVAISGRILGAEFAAAMSGTPGVRLIMLWTSSISPKIAGDVAEIVYVTGQESASTPSYSAVKSAFDETRAKLKPTLLVGVDGAASQLMTPYCSAKSPNGLNGERLQVKYEFCGIDFGSLLAPSDCALGFLSQTQADAIYEYATTAALEETLKGKEPSTVWQGFKPEWGELIEAR